MFVIERERMWDLNLWIWTVLDDGSSWDEVIITDCHGNRKRIYREEKDR